MTDVMKLLSQFLCTWHVDNLDIGQCLVMERAFDQLRGKEMDFVWSKVSIPLSFIVQSKFEFKFMYDHDSGFHIPLSQAYNGGMRHKMI